jgi:hypothetical protein
MIADELDERRRSSSNPWESPRFSKAVSILVGRDDRVLVYLSSVSKIPWYMNRVSLSKRTQRR